MKLHTMTAAAAVLIGLTGVALAQQDIFVEKGMMVEGGEDFSYAGTWGTTGYVRDLYSEAPAQSEAAPAPVTRTITSAPAPASAQPQITRTAVQTRTVSPAPATTLRYPASTSTPGETAAPTPAPSTSTLRVTAQPVPAWPVTRAPSRSTVSATRPPAPITRRATVTQPVQRIVSPAAPAITASVSQPAAPA